MCSTIFSPGGPLVFRNSGNPAGSHTVRWNQSRTLQNWTIQFLHLAMEYHSISIGITCWVYKIKDRKNTPHTPFISRHCTWQGTGTFFATALDTWHIQNYFVKFWWLKCFLWVSHISVAQIYVLRQQPFGNLKLKTVSGGGKWSGPPSISCDTELLNWSSRCPFPLVNEVRRHMTHFKTKKRKHCNLGWQKSNCILRCAYLPLFSLHFP